MKIQESTVRMESSSYREEERTVMEKMNFWVDEKNIVAPEKDTLELSDQAKALNENNKSNESVFSLSAKDMQNIELIEKFFKILTGKVIKIQIPEEIKIISPDTAEILFTDGNKVNINTNTNTNLNTDGTEGWGVNYSYNETNIIKEGGTFNSSGQIITEDGRKINFQLNYEVNTEKISSKSIEIKGGDALIDPLVINFNGSIPQLSDEKMMFDLDADGEEDNVNKLSNESAFLALDKNNDGIINDGSELFGPKSGDGFGELAQYDEDNNNWIDEGDKIFNKLKLWVQDADGNNKLLALAEKGIGAIYLGNVEMGISVFDQAGDNSAQVQKSGVAVLETGEAVGIHHIDFSK